MKKVIVLIFDTEGRVSQQMTDLLKVEDPQCVQPIEIEGNDQDTVSAVKLYIADMEVDKVYAYTEDLEGLVYRGLRDIIDVTVSNF